MKFKVGDEVVMWHRSGKGIYDGNVEFVRAIDPAKRRYGLSEINEGGAIGWMPEAHLMPHEEFKQLVTSRQIGRLWQGNEDKLVRIYKRYGVATMTTKTALERAQEHVVLANRLFADLNALRDDLSLESPIRETIEACYGIIQTIWIQAQRELKEQQQETSS